MSWQRGKYTREGRVFRAGHTGRDFEHGPGCEKVIVEVTGGTSEASGKGVARGHGPRPGT